MATMLRAFTAIGESASLLAHDIKNPITAVHMALRAVAGRLGEDPRAVLEDFAARMQQIEQRMRQTLAFVAPIELRPRLSEARTLFDAAIARLRPEIERCRATVSTRTAGGDVEIHGDPALLQDVLAHLIANALETGCEGLHVELVAQRAVDGSVLVSVEDDGPGIAPAVHRTLFAPFVTTKSDGNGLGLAVCRRIVEEHGGTIDLVPARASGARFEIRLPAPNGTHEPSR